MQYARRSTAGDVKEVQGSRQYIPLKLNSAGVMPIIFAQAIMFIPGALAQKAEGSFQAVGASFADINGLGYNVLFAVLIIVFSVRSVNTVILSTTALVRIARAMSTRIELGKQFARPAILAALLTLQSSPLLAESTSGARVIKGRRKDPAPPATGVRLARAAPRTTGMLAHRVKKENFRTLWCLGTNYVHLAMVMLIIKTRKGKAAV